MFGPCGVGQIRGVTLGPQPLKATIPYQLSSKPRSHRRDGKTAGKPKSHQLSSGMRRTMSLDAIIGPYLQGHWPKEPEGPSSPSRKDKSTQTPDSCAEHLREGSCSLGTTWTQPIPIPLAPLCTLVPRLRCSVEGLNQELEGMFICQPAHPQHRLLEVPDGHRAPVPPQSCSSGSQSDPATTLLSSSPSSSPTNFSNSPPDPEDAPLDVQQGLTDGAEMCLLSPFSSQNEADLSSSPGPNKSCCFQREPPEGCERVKVWEESSSPRQPMPALLSSCPDPNKVNFTPYGGSAFCPVSLLRPLLPSMDMLFRSLAVSPAGSCSSQGMGQALPDPPSTSPAVMGESSGEGLAF
ncbi:hypothetical protein JOQ06_027209 [Pogonophryne albipinna]|uniref:Protein FAM117A n=1 Tax=Pogonophryne albipinna TaxID=1090488 RepID=A0AAD6BCH2_9TELE|nr:hypothetical protein JOQ06_027209 [Pogonophryne albipinna]